MRTASTAFFHRLLPALALAAIATASNLAAAPVYLGIFDGNDDLASVKSAIFTSTSQNVDISLYDKSDSAPVLSVITGNPSNPNKEGTWNVLDDSVFISYLTVKASNRFTLYAYSPAVNSGDWSTANILNKNGKQQDLSHLSLWTAPQSSEVPEPSSLALIGGGLTGLAILSKRRKRTA